MNEKKNLYKVTLDYENKIKLIVQELECMNAEVINDIEKDEASESISCFVLAKDEIDAKKEAVSVLCEKSEKFGVRLFAYGDKILRQHFNYYDQDDRLHVGMVDKLDDSGNFYKMVGKIKLEDGIYETTYVVGVLALPKPDTIIVNNVLKDLGLIICREEDETNETIERRLNLNENTKEEFWYRVTLDYRAEPKLTAQEVPSITAIGPMRDLKVEDGSVSCIVSAENVADAIRTGFRFFYLNSKDTGVKLFRQEDVSEKLLLTLNCKNMDTGIGMFDGNVTLYKLLPNFNPRNYDPNITLFEEYVELFCCVRAFKQRDPKVMLFSKRVAFL